MKVPNCSNAYISESKITGYLLNINHPDATSKAAFFLNHGFFADDSEYFKSELLQLLLKNDFIKEIDTIFGKKFIVDGNIQNTQHRKIRIRTIWMIKKKQDFPSFITAYPYSS